MQSDYSPLKLSIRFRLLAITVLTIPLVWFGASGAESNSEWVIFGISIVAYCVLAAPILLSRSFAIVEPYSIIFLIFYLGIPLKLDWLLYAKDSSEVSKALNGESLQSIIAPACLAIGSIFAICCGYSVGKRMPMRVRFNFLKEKAWNRTTVILLCGVLSFLSAAVFFAYAQRQGVDLSDSETISSKRIEYTNVAAEGTLGRGSSLGYYRWAVSISQIVFCVLFAWIAKLKRVQLGFYLLVFVPPLAVAFAMPIIASSRTPLVYFLVQCSVIAYCLKRNMLSSYWMTLQVSAILLIATVFMGVGAVRSKGELTSRSLNPMMLFESVVKRGYLADIAKTAAIYHAVPQDVPYMHGESYSAFFVAPIPRNWWPMKPAIGLGPYVGEHVFHNKFTGVPPGMIGEAYINFGVIGAIIIPLCYGLFAGSSFATLSSYLGTRVGALIYACLFRIYVGVAGMDFSSALVQLAKDIIPIIAIIWIVQLKDSRG